ncbi:MAG: hypothetical protein IT447_09770 [Phycisphaerales bacterium]|jgi:hypothetical protein|nr:hypothetical protein [Phycisphaerales bacterium]
MDDRSIQESNGFNRDNAGRFLRGNRLGRGNPFAKRITRLRSALLKAVTTEDIAEVVQMLMDKAKAGDVAAARELLDRTIGKARQPVDVTSGDGVDDRPVEFTLNIGHKILPGAMAEQKLLEQGG